MLPRTKASKSSNAEQIDHYLSVAEVCDNLAVRAPQSFHEGSAVDLVFPGC